MLFDADKVPALPQDFLDKGGKASVQPRRKKHPTEPPPAKKNRVLRILNDSIIQLRELTPILLHFVFKIDIHVDI